MRRQLEQALVGILPDQIRRVDGQRLERVQRHQKCTNIGLKRAEQNNASSKSTQINPR